MARSVTDVYLNRPESRSEPSLIPEIVVDGGMFAGASDRARKAGSRLMSAVDPFKREGGKISGIRGRYVGGAGTILALLAAANELNDPSESAGRNLAQAGGAGAGGILGGMGGAAVGQLLIPVPGVGALVGATLGGMLGTESGKGLATLAADLVEGSPEDRAIRNAQKQAQAAAESEALRAQILMPIQDQAAQIALRNEEARQKIASDTFLRQTMAQGLLAQQQYGAQQQLAMANAILGGGL